MSQASPIAIYRAERVPILQNRVYADRASALGAPTGSLDIGPDPSGLIVNRAFDPSRMVYDEDYDNAVPSQVFIDYYDDIAHYLVKKYGVARGRVLDIGCGKGTFLTQACALYPELSGIGIDPSYEGDLMREGGRLRFIQSYFDHQTAADLPRPDLIVCRHTLEHIPNPAAFLREVVDSVRAWGEVPIFIEVPDLGWTLEQRAFWDFCYEHVNYFTPHSLTKTLESSGISVSSVKAAFGDQYLWAEGVCSPRERVVLAPGTSTLGQADVAISEFAHDMASLLQRLREQSTQRKIAVWGMATKGVLYSLFLQSNGLAPSATVDINVRKQGRYCPVSGLQISPPEALRAGEDWLIICMNPNYASEIRSLASKLCDAFALVDPWGRQIN